MIKIINGIIGGGKTSLSIAYVYSLVPNKMINKPIIKDSDFDLEYKKIYTNISGFKGDDFYIPVEFLNFDILDKCALVLFLLLDSNKHIQDIDNQVNSFYDQVADNISFEQLNTNLNLESIEVFYAEIVGFRFNRVLLVIDEFADYFQDKKQHLVKWFNWSRHLYQDMILVQNDISEVARAYKNDKVVKHYIQAADPENRWHPSLFKYAYFKKHLQPQNGIEFFKNVWIPKWIFDKYVSGANNSSFPKIYKYLIFFSILIIFLVYLIFKVLNKGSDLHEHEPVLIEKSETQIKNPMQQSHEQKISYTPKVKIEKRAIACFKCTNDICVYKHDIYSLNRISAAIKTYNFKSAYTNKRAIFDEYCYHVDKSFLKQYEKKKVTRHKTISKINSFALP